MKKVLEAVICILIGVSIGFLSCRVIYYKAVKDAIEDNQKNQSSIETEYQSLPLDGLMFDVDIQKLNQIYYIIKSRYYNEYTDDQIREGIYRGMLAGLEDPYTGYYNKEELDKYLEDESSVYCGIGFMVSQSVKDYIIHVTKVFEGSPAEAVGIQPEDIVTKVAGKDISGIEVALVVKDIRGEENTYVELEVYRPSTGEFLTFNVVRKQIEAPSVEGKMLDDNIGYIAISGFEEKTFSQYQTIFNKLNSQKLNGLVIDLRNNGGGLVDSACDILRQILPAGTIVYIEDKDGRRNTWECDGKHELNIPIVVLVNGYSASASELFAGALMDYNKATLVGTKTYGKGVVQTIYPLNAGDGVKVTIAKYFTPSGKNIHKIGITPDVVEEDVNNQLDKAISIIKEKMQ